MRIEICSHFFDLYFVGGLGDYDIRTDEMLRSQFNFRIHRLFYSRQKGWRSYRKMLLSNLPKTDCVSP